MANLVRQNLVDASALKFIEHKRVKNQSLLQLVFNLFHFLFYFILSLLLKKQKQKKNPYNMKRVAHHSHGQMTDGFCSVSEVYAQYARI